MKKQKNTITNLIISFVIAALLVVFFNVGFSLIYEEPEYPNCYVGLPKADDTTTYTSEECDALRDAYMADNEQYRQKQFYFSLVIGLAAIMVGLFLDTPAIMWGLMIGGGIQLVFGGIVYWEHMTKFVRFVSIGIALIALIFLANKKLKDR